MPLGLSNFSGGYYRLLKILEKYLPILSVLFFFGGIYSTDAFPDFGLIVDEAMIGFIDGYTLLAPAVIYLVLTPALAKVLGSTGKSGGGFVGRMMLWFAGTRALASLWAVLFVWVTFQLPFCATDDLTWSEAVRKSMRDLGWMLLHSPYFYAIYASLISIYLALRIKFLMRLLAKAADLVEAVGEHFVLVIPLFMLAIGAYVSNLPKSIEKQIVVAHQDEGSVQYAGGTDLGGNLGLQPLKIFGESIDVTNSRGMVVAYFVGALATGLGCLLWHVGLLTVGSWMVPGFSARAYFRNYWLRVYPLLWSTSSEALATPLNLYLVKKYYPKITDEIRGFTIGGGSFLGVNGTIICVYVMTGVVASMLGIEVSVFQLLISVPLVFVLGYGVPGIPGELVVFAGPVAVILGVNPELMPIFLAMYVGLQIGLPDSFRSGGNSTDNCVNGVILQEMYDRRLRKELQEDVNQPPIVWQPCTTSDSGQ